MSSCYATTSSLILQDGETFIQDQLTTVDFNNDEDQASNLEEVGWNDDCDGGYRDNSEVEWNDYGDGGYEDNSEDENDSSDSSIKLSAKHIKKKSNKKYKNVLVEDDDDRSESCESENSYISKISSIEPQGELELRQFC
jgi:hypothetical protein